MKIITVDGMSANRENGLKAVPTVDYIRYI
jgi:hypothetical protein